MFRYLLKNNPRALFQRPVLSRQIMRYNHTDLIKKMKTSRTTNKDCSGVCSGYAYMAIGYGVNGKIEDFLKKSLEIYNSPEKYENLKEFQSFFHGIEVSQSPYQYPKLLGGHYGQTDIKAIFNYLFEQKITPSPSNIKFIHNEVINSEVNSIIKTFEKIAEIANCAKTNMYMHITNPHHAICIRYDHIHKYFEIIDANDFPHTEIVEAMQIGEATKDALDGKTYPLYGLQIYCDKPIPSFPKRLSPLKNINLNIINDPSAKLNMLSIASKNGDLDALKYLIQTGAIDFSKKDIDIYNLTSHAVASNKLDSLKILADSGADLTIPAGENGTSLIHRAVSYGFSDICEYLLDQPCVLANLGDSYGNTPLHYAVSEDHPHIVKLLIKYNAYLDAQDLYYRRSPLHIAVLGEQTEIVSLLIAAGANPNLVEASGMTAYDIACDIGNKEIADMVKRTSPKISTSTF